MTPSSNDLTALLGTRFAFHRAVPRSTFGMTFFGTDQQSGRAEGPRPALEALRLCRDLAEVLDLLHSGAWSPGALSPGDRARGRAPCLTG